MSTELLSTCSGYMVRLFKSISSQYMSKEFCDMELVSSGGRIIKAHKNILSAACPYFHSMFTSGLCETNKNVIHIQNISFEVLEKLLGFIYTGGIKLTTDIVQDVLTSADMFGLSEVVDICCDFLKQQLDPSNCVGIYLFADAHSCVALRDAADAFIDSNFIEVINHDEFVQMPVDALVHTLNSENLRSDSEYQIFESAMQWLFEDISKRRRFVYKILAAVRMPIISLCQLESYIESCSDLSVKIVLQKLVSDYSRERRSMQTNRRFVSPLQYQPRKHSRKTIYVIGGYTREEGGRWCDSRTTRAVESFNCFDHQWNPVVSMMNPRSGHGIVSLNGCIYVVGGENDSMIYDTAEFYDPEKGVWNALPPMTTPRCGLGLCAVGEVIYAFGGWIGCEIGTTIEAFDSQEKTWLVVEKVDRNRQRFAMGTVNCNDLIYLVGGMNDAGKEVKSVDSYNPVTHEWNSLADMHIKRAYVSIGVIDSCIYVAGGWNDTGGALATVEKYSIENDVWSYVSPMCRARAGASVAAVNGLLYVIGGRTYSSEFHAPATLSSVECYNPELDIWTELESMSTSKCEAGLAVL